VNTLGDTRDIVLQGAMLPHRQGRGTYFKKVGAPRISGMVETGDLKFCVHIQSWGPNENYAKVYHRGSGAGNPLVSPEQLKLTLEILHA